MQTQNDIDKIYDDFCTVVKNEMPTKLPQKELSIALVINVDGFVNPGGMMIYGVYGMKCVVQKNHGYDVKTVKNATLNLKHIFVQRRKWFDQRVQRCKRNYWFKIQNEMVESAKNNLNKFWKTIGRIGVRYNRR